MKKIPWTKIAKIIAYILNIMAEGVSKNTAIKRASSKFGYSSKEISKLF
jgi:hypothetical protein